MAKLPQSVILTLCALVMCAGGTNILLISFMAKQKVPQGYEKHGQEVIGTFNHPFIVCILMFIGEASCISVYFGRRIWAKKDYEQERKEALDEGKKEFTNWALLWPMLSGGADIGTTVLQFVAIMFVPGSVYLLLAGAAVIVTAAINKVVFGINQNRNQLIGCLSVFIGITIVGLNTVFFPTEEEDNPHSTSEMIMAIGLIILSLLFNGVGYCTQEFLFSRYHLDQFLLISLEGIYGIIIFVCAILPLSGLIPCALQEKECNYDSEGEFRFESTYRFIEQVKAKPILLLMFAVYMTLIAFTNCVGLTITKHTGTVLRAITDVTRTLLVWVVGITMTLLTSYTMENTYWKAVLLEGAGFSVIIFGNLIYNNLVCKQEEKEQVKQNEDNDNRRKKASTIGGF